MANTHGLLVLAWVATQFIISPTLTAQEPAAQFDFGKQRVHSLAFSPDGQLLAAGNFRGQVRVWDVAQRKEIQTIAAHGLQVSVLRFLDRGKSLVSVDSDGEVKVWESSTWKPTNNFFTATTYAGAVSPDGKQLVIGGFGKASSFDLVRGQRGRQFAHQTVVVGVVISPDGKMLVTASNSSAKLWDFAKGQEVATLPFSGGGNLTCLAMTSDGRFLAAGTEQKLVHVWDLAQRKVVKQLAVGAAEIVKCVVFSPNNTTLAVSNGVGDLRLFNFASGKETKKWNAAVSEQLAYSTDGSLLATAGMTVEGEGKVQLWTVAKPIVKEGPDTDAASQPGNRPKETKPASVVRLWTSADGKYKLRASLVRVAGDQAYFKREDNGKVIGVRIELLSAKDQELLRGH